MMMNARFDRHVLLAEGGIKYSTRATFAAAALYVASTIAGLCAAPAVFAAGGVKAAYVEQVLPSKPFSAMLLTESYAAGPSAGVLGITSLTIYNAGNVDTFVSLYATEVVGPTCESAPVLTAKNRMLTFFRITKATQIHVTYPSPLVVEPIGGAANGLTCIRFVGGSNMSVNGFVN